MPVFKGGAGERFVPADKVVSSLEGSISGIEDGATVAIGGFFQVNGEGFRINASGP